MTNLIDWMILHSEMTITEHHHHDQIDLFQEFNRIIPFGTGTSIMYNYLDYRFRNDTDNTYQLIIYTTDEYLCGELRAEKKTILQVPYTGRERILFPRGRRSLPQR
jgi:vancomycin resistance protein VanW